MNNYELLYILPASKTGEEITKDFQDVQKHIEKFGGKMLETLLDHPFLTKAGMSKEDEPEELKALPLVKRKLAYPIKHEKFGFYCLVNFQAEGKKIEDIDEYLRLNAHVLRHLITEADPMTKEELELLQALFARKKAEQDKEEAESAKAKEDMKKAPRRETEAKKEKVVEDKTEKAAEEVKKEAEGEKEAAPKAEKPESEPEEKTSKEKVKADAPQPKDKKEESKGKKSKIKLEELEDKLDKILEDTIV